MKNIILLVYFLMLSIVIHGQIDIDFKITKSVDDFIKQIDTATLNSGILYDRVIPHAKLLTFNVKENTSDVIHFEQALNELYNASKKKKFLSVEKYRENYDVKPNVVNIGIINTVFHYLNYNPKDEEKGGLRLSKKKLTVVENKSPFLKKEAFIVSPLKKQAFGNIIYFRFEDSFIIQTADENKINHLSVDFGNGEVHDIIENGKLITKEVPIHYKAKGKKTLIFNGVFDGVIKKQTKGTLLINPSKLKSRTGNRNVQTRFLIESSYSFMDYGESSPIYSELEYEVFYHKKNGVQENTIIKPILFIDGFDPLDERKILEEEMPSGSEIPSIEEMMVYGNNRTSIIPELTDLGYDVIIVNHPIYTRNGYEIDGGADYIERNAMSHITLYQHLNSQLANNNSDEELVIIGPSMGGQISRYALAYMEKKLEETEDDIWDHNTRLWVSLDSPHQGANIPIGAQANVYFLGFFNGNQEAIDIYSKGLQSFAARQMLIDQFTFWHSSNSLFNQYYSNLTTNGLPNSNGYPINLRKISIINGALDGDKNGTAGDKVLDIRGYNDFLWFTIRSFLNIIRNSHNTGRSSQVFFGEVDEVFSGYSLGVTDTNQNSKGSMDIVPGGTFDTQGVLKNRITQVLEQEGRVDRYAVRTFKPNHTFIPTHSALDTNNYSNWNQPINKNLECSNQTPFDTYYGENTNTEHVSFTTSSKNWLFEELAGNEQSPPIPPRYISGNFNPMAGGYERYSVPNISGASYNWRIESIGFGTSDWSIYGSGSSSVSVSIGDDPVRLVCEVSNGCPDFVRNVNLYPYESSDNEDCDIRIQFSSNPMTANSFGNTISVKLPLLCPIFRTNNNITHTISIYNVLGEKVFVQTQEKVDFNISHLEEGYYIVEYKFFDGSIITKNLIIEK